MTHEEQMQTQMEARLKTVAQDLSRALQRAEAFSLLFDQSDNVVAASGFSILRNTLQNTLCAIEAWERADRAAEKEKQA